MDISRYIDTLRAGAATLGVACDDALAGRLAAHQALANKWAKRINLTTVTDEAEAAIRHGLDCLLFAHVMDEPEPGLTVDVGSGGGFPGVILGLAQPARPMILLEPIRKRASFLRTAAAELGAKNIRVVEGRLETGRPAPRIPWPVPTIVSRATIPPLELVPIAAEYLAPGGTLVLTAGAGAPDPAALSEVAAHAGLAWQKRDSFELPGGLTRVLDHVVRP